MERNGALIERLPSWLRKLAKYRYAALIVLIGVALMLLPGRTERSEAADPIPQTAGESVWAAEDFCRQLEEVLGQMEGAGTVSCLLTWREGIRTVYQTDTLHAADGEVKVSTVLVSAGSGTESAVAAGVIGPVYQGVVVVCDGADSAQLRLDITQAVSALTGLGSDKIAVVKRKG